MTSKHETTTIYPDIKPVFSKKFDMDTVDKIERYCNARAGELDEMLSKLKRTTKIIDKVVVSLGAVSAVAGASGVGLAVPTIGVGGVVCGAVGLVSASVMLGLAAFNRRLTVKKKKYRKESVHIVLIAEMCVEIQKDGKVTEEETKRLKSFLKSREVHPETSKDLKAKLLT